MIIYVVMGGSGAYDDTRTWTVRAYRERQLAEQAIARLERRVIRLEQLETAAYRRPSRRDPAHPQARIDTKYFNWWEGLKPDTWDPLRDWGNVPPSYAIVETELI